MRPVLLVVCAAVLGLSGFALARSIHPSHASGARAISRPLVQSALRNLAASSGRPLGAFRLPQALRRQSANSVSFTDATGDSGIAPDVTSVTAANDDSGTITITASIPNRAALSTNDMLLIVIDSDPEHRDGR